MTQGGTSGFFDEVKSNLKSDPKVKTEVFHMSLIDVEVPPKTAAAKLGSTS